MRLPPASIWYCLLFVLLFTAQSQARVIQDMAGRCVHLPDQVNTVYCSGPGCLRLTTYLQCSDLVVAVDALEKKEHAVEARPYVLAHPEYSQLPLGGEFRGRDNPELLLSLDPQPQVILKTFPTMGMDPDTLQNKTGIPVVSLYYGDLGQNRELIHSALMLMGQILDCQSRAKEVLAFMEDQIAELLARTESIPLSSQPSVFVGGVAFKGPHGFQSTEPNYPAFRFVPAQNLAAREGTSGPDLRHSIVAKEQIMMWDPEVLFLDLATLQLGGQEGGLYELRNDPSYQTLSAVQENHVYGLLPYNWYATNFGSVLANAYFIGSVLYPERFADVDVQERAEKIFSFLVGSPVLDALIQELEGMAFQPIQVH